MGLDIQKLIQEGNQIAVNRRHSSIRHALVRYKHSGVAPERYGRSTQEERTLLENAMRDYKEFAQTDEQKRAYNILLYYYFSTKPLTDLQLAKLFKIEKRTVYKCISKGVNDLTFLIFGVDVIIFNDDDPFPAFWHTASLGKKVKKRLENPERLLDEKMELLKALRGEFASYIRENPKADLMAEMAELDVWIAEEREKGRKPMSDANTEDMRNVKEEEERRQNIRAALGALREGKATNGVKAILVKAMDAYKSRAHL